MHQRNDPQAIVDEATLRLYYKGRDNGNTLTVSTHRVLALVRNNARRSTPPSRLTRLTGTTGSAIIRSVRDGRHEAVLDLEHSRARRL